MRKHFAILMLSLGLLFQTSFIPLRGMALGAEGLVPVPIPAGIASIQPVIKADLDGDGTLETLDLTADRLSILSRGGARVAWQSPQDWQVRQAAIADLNGDGQPEVVLLLWRPFRPWPVDQWLPVGGRISGFQNAAGRSCHIILIGWKGGGYREVWAGSAMADPITFFATADLNGDQIQELVALEGRYTDPGSAPARTVKLWKWNGFGFSVVSSMDGNFSKMALVQASDGRLLILVP